MGTKRIEWVYFNLHRMVWSRMVKGIVQGHAAQVVLRNATFVVREGGRQRVLREGRKNVHAFVKGEAFDIGASQLSAAAFAAQGWTAVTYRPTSGPSFTSKATGRPIVSASLVAMLADRSVWAFRPVMGAE